MMSRHCAQHWGCSRQRDRHNASIMKFTFQGQSQTVRLIHEYSDKKTKGDESGEGPDGENDRADAILNGVIREGLSEKVTSEPTFEGTGE